MRRIDFLKNISQGSGLRYCNFSSFLPIALCAMCVVSSCKKEEIDTRDYPKEIGEIMVGKCAVSGCHNAASKAAASDLDLTTWETMMEGSRNGAVNVPFTHTQSSLFLFTNTYEDLGVVVPPSMPYNKAPLSRDEVLAIRIWISEGSPNANGKIKFTDDPNRKKYYVLNRGCDLVAVIDRETDLVMRYVKTTFSLDVEFAEEVQIAPNGQFWYVVSKNGEVISKYRVDDDSYVGTVILEHGKWKSFCISADSQKAFVLNCEAEGSVAYIDLNSMSVIQYYDNLGTFAYPYTACLDGNNLLIGSQSGNMLYRLNVADPLSPTLAHVMLQAGQSPDTSSSFNPQKIFLHPTNGFYYVACTGTDEVRVYNRTDDSFVTSISVGAGPENLTFSASRNYLFVASTEDTQSFTGKRGSIAVVDCATNSVVTTIYSGAQPHGMAVDELGNRLIVANRNFSQDGPAPHHVTECDGRNGYLTYIDLNTLSLIPNRRFEISVDPFAVTIRN